MGIIIDGRPISEKSSLTQYMNKPFLLWCNKIFERIYLELGNQYRLIYNGRVEELQIIKTLLFNKKWCSSISFKECVINRSLQERMIALNQFIKSNNLTNFRREKISVTFIGSDAMLKKYNALINKIEIANAYCEVFIKTIRYNELDSVNKNDRLVLLCDNGSSIDRIKNIDSYKVKYVLMENGNTQFLNYDENIFTYGFSVNDFFDGFFQCLFIEDLLEAFTSTIKQVSQLLNDDSMRKKLTSLIAIRPKAEIYADKRIEAGCSTTLQISCYPHVSGYMPKLTFKYQFPNVVRCDQKFVHALSPGKTIVDMFEQGTFESVARIDFEVYTVNRITDIYLSESVLPCGIGDIHQLTCEYVPDDAENANLLRWRSDNEHIAKVNSTGKVKVVGEGKCHIYCEAESVSAKCEVDSKPYLRQIVLPDICSNGHLHMNIGETQQIKCKLNPPNAYDNDLVISSTDLMVINVLGDKLKAVSAGNATVVIENRSKRLRVSFVAHVKDKNSGFFKRLFGG